MMHTPLMIKKKLTVLLELSEKQSLSLSTSTGI